MNFSHTDLSLQLSWMPKVNGITPPTPGFYLRGSYANEGAAIGVVPGSWENGYGGYGSLMPYNALTDLGDALKRNNLLLPPFQGLGATLAAFSSAEQHKALDSKRSRLETLKAEVEALEQELS